MARRRDMWALLKRLKDDFAMLIDAAGEPIAPTKDRLLRVTPEVYDLLVSEYNLIIQVLSWKDPRRAYCVPATAEPDTDSESSTTGHSPESEA